MSTSAIGTTLDAIRAGLISVSGMSGVNVFSGPVAEEEGGQECIWFGDAALTEVEMSMGGSRTETWDVSGEVWAALKPWQAATGTATTETTIKAARDRLLVIYGLLETYINDTYLGTYPMASLTAGTLRQGIIPEGRRCAMDFTLTVENHKNP
jgi:hypothetical protein